MSAKIVCSLDLEWVRSSNITVFEGSIKAVRPRGSKHIRRQGGGS